MNKINLDYALRYAKLDWYVIPVKSDKTPIQGYGLNSATKDPALINKIWTEHPSANIAIACERSGLVVLDIDPRNGGNESLVKLEAEYGAFESVVVAGTQSGGEHRVFKAEPGITYPGTLGAGLDVKHRGYILVEPSLGESGVYGWHEGKDPLNGALPSDAPLILQGTARDDEHSLSVKVKPGSVIIAPSVYDELRAALKVIPPESDYSSWFKVLQGLSRLENLKIAYEIALEWSTSSCKQGHDVQALKKKWQSCLCENFVVNYASIFYMADEADRSWRKPQELQAPRTDQRPSVLDSPIQPLTEEEAASARLNPRMLVENYLYADLRNIVAAGGVGKTTSLLYEAMNGALGRPIWDHNVPDPFNTVFVTKEDSREILVGRLKLMMDQNELSSCERLQVWSRVAVIDLVGDPFKLASSIGQEITPHWENLEKLLMRCIPLKPDRFIFDPLMSFGVGESRVNDAEQAIVEAGRYILRRFPGCAVDVVHHTGKANARAATTDQYSGRNGSALPDGSRMVAVLVQCSAATFYSETGISLGQDGESGLKIALPKLSYCAPQPDIFIHRQGFLFSTVSALNQEMRATLTEKIKQDTKDVTRDATRYSLLCALTDCAESDDPLDRYPGRSRAIELPGVVGKTTSRTAALIELIDSGAVLEIAVTEVQLMEFSSKRLLGGRKTYLTIAPEIL